MPQTADRVFYMDGPVVERHPDPAPAPVEAQPLRPMAPPPTTDDPLRAIAAEAAARKAAKGRLALVKIGRG